MKTNYFDIFQILPAIFWLFIIYIIAFFKRQNIKGEHAKYYIWNVTTKLFFSLVFVLYYYFIVRGGDTIAYFDGAITLNNLFWKSPTMYFEQLFNTPDVSTWGLYFDAQTGYPPGWIYREPQSFIISKIASVFCFFTFRSYLATTFIIAFIMANASWRLFKFALRLEINNKKWLAFAILFLPSVNFWCSGISKDTFILIGIYWIVSESYKNLILKEKIKFKKLILLLLGFILIYNVRKVVFGCVFFLVSISVLNTYLEKNKIKRNTQTFVKVLFFSIGILFIGRSLIFQSEEQFLEQNSLIKEAAVTQQDFENNKLYTGQRYSIGTIDFSPIGLIKVAPAAIIAGSIRPFPWEALSPSLILNGLECTLFFYLIFKFFSDRFRDKVTLIRHNEFLRYSLNFVLLLGFIAGLTSGILGVLVRIRAPVLAFLLILLTIDFNLKIKKN